MEMSEVFWTFFITSIIGCMLKLSSMVYKSKCKQVDICCLKIVRDVETEEKEMEFITTHHIPTINSSEEGKENI
jgi:hypothetical protein